MQQFTQHAYGDAAVLELADAPMPTPSRGHVVVRMLATSINAGDVRVMRGDPLLVRLFFGLRRPRGSVRGMDAVGTVHSVGVDVIPFRPGDTVVAEAPGGAFAEYVRIPADRCVALTPDINVMHAAALPVAGGTAMLAVERAQVADGERVLVLGASGGVGHFVVQLAAARGALVAAVVRPEAAALAKQWGATQVYERGASAEMLTADGRYDVVVDLSGDRPLRDVRAMLADGGRAALVAGTGGRVFGPIPRIVRAMFLTRKRAKLIPISGAASPARLARLVDLLASGDIAPHVAQASGFETAPAAVAAVDAGGIVGKAVLTFAGGVGS